MISAAVLITMVVGSNVRWQGSKIWQCRLEGVARYVNLWSSVHKGTDIFNSS